MNDLNTVRVQQGSLVAGQRCRRRCEPILLLHKEIPSFTDTARARVQRQDIVGQDEIQQRVAEQPESAGEWRDARRRINQRHFVP